MINRIEKLIEALLPAVQGLAPAKADELSKELNLDFMSHAAYQTHKSALMGVKITVDEAQTIYQKLGNIPDVFNSQPLHVKIAITKVMNELLH